MLVLAPGVHRHGSKAFGFAVGLNAVLQAVGVVHFVMAIPADRHERDPMLLWKDSNKLLVFNTPFFKAAIDAHRRYRSPLCPGYHRVRNRSAILVRPVQRTGVMAAYSLFVVYGAAPFRWTRTIAKLRKPFAG